MTKTKKPFLECKSCGRLIFEDDDLSYGCPNCESKFIDKYEGIIGIYTHQSPPYPKGERTGGIYNRK